MQHNRARSAAVIIALTATIGALASSASLDAAPVLDGGPDPVTVELVGDAIDAIDNLDAPLYDDVRQRLESGEVWIPDLIVDAIADRDVASLDFWVDILDEDDIELYSWASAMVDAEKRSVGELANGAGSITELALTDEDGFAVLQILDSRRLPVPPRARLALSAIAPSGQPPEGSVYDGALRSLDGIYFSGDPFSAVQGSPPPPPPSDGAEYANTPIPPPDGIDGDPSAPGPPPDAITASPNEPVVAAEPVPPADGEQVAPSAEPVVAASGPSPNQGSSDQGSSSDLLVGLALGVAVISMLVGIGAALRGRRHDKLADYAFTDSLTGLRNRRRMDADVAEQNELSTRPTATLMIDVDHFKRFNDSYGHATGDEVLRIVGATLARYFRKTDVPYRYGGEEFCVLLPETTEVEAMLAGERIRAAVAAIELPVDDHITVSIGVSIGPASEISSTLQRADGALYAAKAGGRNRVALG